ncbi:MAG: hypothetical protein H6627_10825 [Calditrichae bacterium]|nr:hypothetical protein [Calditrichia bacterium]
MDSYKSVLQEHIKEALNDWISDLKEKQPELLLTRQWQLLFPKGFTPGQNIIPVVSGSRQGRHLVAEVLFVLPDNLELDLQAVELLLKNEPYKTAKKKQSPKSLPFDQALDTLDAMISGINRFLSDIQIFPNPTPTPSLKLPPSPSAMEPVKTVNIKQMHPWQDVPPAAIREQFLNNDNLPDWFQTITDSTVKGRLLDSMVQAFVHYRQHNPTLSIKEFIRLYSEKLLKQEKLYPYCPYKAKAVKLNDEGHCLESYCSKKPFREVCPVAGYKFGKVPESL